jgi:hypothetical protein
MSNGNHGTLKNKNKQKIRINPQEPVARILVYQVDREYLCGFRFYSKSGEILLEVGVCKSHPTVFVLQEDERVLGIKSRIDAPHDAYHCDLQFVIGRLEA